jgi:hypothetical protein
MPPIKASVAKQNPNIPPPPENEAAAKLEAKGPPKAPSNLREAMGRAVGETPMQPPTRPANLKEAMRRSVKRKGKKPKE